METEGREDEDIDTSGDFGDLYLRNVSLFYLKLQGKFLLPASTIQSIVEEMDNIHVLGQAYTLSRLCSLLQNDTSLSDDDIAKVCDSVKESDTFKKMFHYVEPKKLLLGRDENGKDRFAYYVPIKDTLRHFLESKLWLDQSAHVTEQSETGVLSDITDTDHMSLVLLCKENDFKTFGHSKVFSDLISDLKELEETGILTTNGTVRGTLYCIAGDNLGSHCIGGLSENFSSSQYFCRYCLVTRNEFQSDDPNVCGPLRTIEKYNSALECLQNVFL